MLASPNRDGRDGHPVDVLVLHYTGMPTAEAALKRLCDPASKVSAHYVVEEDGKVHLLVHESERAWHSGVSCWRGHTNINQRSIGIEIVNPGHEFGYRAFPGKQIESVIALCKEILSRHPIPARNVVGHSDVAPERKEDPGELFPWERLAREGIGLWPEKSSESRVQSSEISLLREYGYHLPENATAEQLKKVVVAFQRHFRRNNIDGVWDEECQNILRHLLTTAN